MFAYAKPLVPHAKIGWPRVRGTLCCTQSLPNGRMPAPAGTQILHLHLKPQRTLRCLILNVATPSAPTARQLLTGKHGDKHVVTKRTLREFLPTAQIKLLQRAGGREQKKKEPKP